jgi:3-oxoacyl-[acyl-carrier-protein] synthase III
MTGKRAIFRGSAHYLPKRVVTNDELSVLMPTNNKWIIERTGINTRYFAGKDETTSSLAINACRDLLSRMEKPSVDAIILATYTPDYLMPSTSSIVQKALGLSGIPTFDIACACSGFVYGSILARHLIQGGMKGVLVIGSETVSKFLNMRDRNTAVLFGDGAGAALYEASDDDTGGILGYDWGTDDYSTPEYLIIPAGGSAEPANSNTFVNDRHYVFMQGKSIFKFAVNIVPKTVEKTLSMAGLDLNDVDLIVPHQANYRIIEASAKSLAIPIARFYINLDRVGNTSAASIPIALSELDRAGRLKKGMKVLMIGFGAGLTWASMLLEIT